MKNSILSLVVLSSIFCASCGIASEQNYTEQEPVYFNEEDFMNSEQQNNDFANQNDPNMQTASFGNQQNQQTNSNWTNNSNDNGGTLKNIIIPNAQTGRPMIYIPVPASWKNTQQGFKGPNGLHAAEMVEMGYHSKINEAIMSPREVVQSASQKIKESGFSITNTYNIQSIAQCRKQMDNQQWKAGPVTNNFTTTAIEAVSNKREKVLFLITHTNTQSQFYKSWGFDVQMMTANDSYFDQGKKAIINALTNMKYDQQYIDQWNQQEQSKAQASNSNFQSRMASNQRNFEARNRATVGAQNDVNTMSMNGYYNRSNSQDRLQQSQVQGTWDRSTVQNSYNGQNYEVEGQAQQYWMDGQGNYIPSNDLNWNPNTDNNYNNTQWTQTQNPNGTY